MRLKEDIFRMKEMMNRLRNYFISGLVVFLPLALSIYLFVWTVNFADGFLGKYLKPYFYETFGFYVRGLGILAGIYLIIVIGFFFTNFVGRKVQQYFERLLLRLPFFKQVYPAVKEMAVFLFSRDRPKSFKQVVLVEYPRKGIYSYGFLTNDADPRLREQTKKKLCNVFVPSSPGPVTGFTILVSKEEIIFTDISIEDAFKFIVSGGTASPIL